MEFSRQAVWAKLKTPAEFITALIALIGLIYGLVWVLDDVVAHVHVRVAHGWWVYQFWHAWWWVLAPILMVAGGRLCARRILGRLLWVVGAVWLTVLAFGVSMAWFGGLLMLLAVSFGWVVGTTLSLAAIIPLALVVVLVGSLVDRARKQSRLFDRVVTPDWSPLLHRTHLPVYVHMSIMGQLIPNGFTHIVTHMCRWMNVRLDLAPKPENPRGVSLFTVSRRNCNSDSKTGKPSQQPS